MPSSYLMRDVIVCIPGITGSVLRKDGKDIWNVSGGAILNALRTLGGSVKELKLEEDPVDADDVDGITATSVIRDVHLIPGLWKIDGYTKLVRHIEERFDVKHGENLFEFAYDWRRDNRVASRQLATKTKGWLEAWRGSPGTATRSSSSSATRWADSSRVTSSSAARVGATRTLVTIGTPYAGSLYALGTLANGKKVKFFDLTEIARSLTAVYQLLPIYPCYDGGDGKLARVAEARIPNLDPAKTKAARFPPRDSRRRRGEHDALRVRRCTLRHPPHSRHRAADRPVGAA